VSFVARKQYRTAMVLRGAAKGIIESQLPCDPLGVSRTDGWELAADIGRMAVEEVGDQADQSLRDVLPVVCQP